MNFSVQIEIEEDIYQYAPANNGASPFWCMGNTCIVECKDRLFVAGLKTLPDAKPLCNCVPLLYVREDSGWKLVYAGEGRTREPSPIVCFPDGRVFLSLNTTLTGPEDYDGPAEPSILVFDAQNPEIGFREIYPNWNGEPEFTEHSYRSFAADSYNQELFILQNVGYTHAEYALMDSDENWIANGQLHWLWEKRYDTPSPVRTCYPQIQLKNRSLFFCGVSDIMEPYGEWREYRKELSGKDWDYDFRRLLFIWSEDITKGEFHQWIELSSRDSTAGHIFVSDMIVDDDLTAHILWTEKSLDTRIREIFFPLERYTNSLNYLRIKNGVVRERRALFVGGEGEEPGSCSMGKFHRAADGRIFVIYHLNKKSSKGSSEMHIAQICNGALVGDCVLDIKKPLTSVFRNTERAGSPISDAVHLLGDCDNTVRYVKINIR